MTAILIIGKGQRVICNIIHIQKGKSSLLEKMGTGTMGGRRFTVSLLKTINAKLHILAMSRHPEPFIMRKNVSQPKNHSLLPAVYHGNQSKSSKDILSYPVVPPGPC